MGYLELYNERRGKCEYCKHPSGSHACGDCWGTSFVDKLDFYGFVKQQAKKDAEEKFNKSDEGKRLLLELEQAEEKYRECQRSYRTKKDEFIDAELKRIDNEFNSI